MTSRVAAVVKLALPAIALIAAWDAFELARLGAPLRVGHEAWIGRQIGRTGLNHVRLGLATTRGATVAVVRRDGSLEVHRSYAPLASWVVALPLAAGLPYHEALRLPVLASMTLFLGGLWAFAAQVWGRRAALLALAFAAAMPVVLVRYGLTCVFEVLALGPLMAALALFARPNRGRLAWLALAASSIAAVMFSWIAWVVVLPGAAREWRLGSRRGAAALAIAAVAVPLGVHFGTAALVSGDPLGDLAAFARHVAERASGHRDAATPVGYGRVLGLLAARWFKGLGLLSMVATAACLGAIAAGRRVPGRGWLVLLLALALPLNLARNIAALHDFFIVLFVPVAAISAALATSWAADRAATPRRRAAVVVGALATFAGLDVAPHLRDLKPWPLDRQQQGVADAVGALVRPGDLVIINPALAGLDPGGPRPPLAAREASPRPYYCGQMCQTALVAYDADEAEALAATAGPGQRVVVLQVGPPTWPLPRGFRPVPADVPRFVAAARGPVRGGARQ